MPLFNTSANKFGMVAIYPGSEANLFNAETLTAPANSTAVAVGEGPQGRKLVNFQIDGTNSIGDNSGFAFYQAVLASATSMQILGSNTYPTSAGFQNGIQIPGSPIVVSSGAPHTVTAFVS